MDEIIKTVSERTGLPEAQAKMAVVAVLDIVKERLTEPFCDHVEALLDDASDGLDAGDLLKMGQMLFKKK